ncbi:hypothetical protein GCM10011610_60140 [Nocardia rhizosphaerihabitans]|uniref:Uncharacterized protein n=1 Tax=Nocardia rhizosphaerihabitans TaxID=1691570 RepID=A0ABQ2KXY2_9NOCA|nr:hypothetical protein GCM10011610_60140 [Nocardia rhizosphaerihabitans]
MAREAAESIDLRRDKSPIGRIPMSGSPMSELQPPVAGVETPQTNPSLANLVEVLEAMRQAGWIVSSTTQPGGIAYRHA